MKQTEFWLRRVWQLIGCILLVVPTTVRGQGSIEFNGFYSTAATSGTSKLEHTTADVLNGNTKQVTMYSSRFLGIAM